MPTQHEPALSHKYMYSLNDGAYVNKCNKDQLVNESKAFLALINDDDDTDLDLCWAVER